MGGVTKCWIDMCRTRTCSWWSGCLARCSSLAEMSKDRDTDCWDCGTRQRVSPRLACRTELNTVVGHMIT